MKNIALVLVIFAISIATFSSVSAAENRNNTEIANMSSAYGITETMNRLVVYVTGQCSIWFPEKRSQMTRERKGWKKRNRHLVKISNKVFDRLVDTVARIDKTSKTRVRSYLNSKIVKAMDGVKVRLGKKTNDQRKQYCDSFISKLDNKVLDIEVGFKKAYITLINYKP